MLCVPKFKILFLSFKIYTFKCYFLSNKEMSLALNIKKLMYTLFPALAVMTGAMLQNSRPSSDKLSTMAGISLFVIGWLGISYSVGSNGKFGKSTKAKLGIAASLTILTSALVTMRAKTEYGDNQPKWVMLFHALFVIGWLVLGYSVGMGKKNPAMYIGLGSAAMVILSNLIALPAQRTAGMVDGPGLPLLTLGWVGFAAAHSM